MPVIAHRATAPTKSGCSDEFYRSTIIPREMLAGQLLSEHSYSTHYCFAVPMPVRTIEIDFRGTRVAITSDDELPAWIAPVAAAIERVACLPDNWNSYVALRLQEQAACNGLMLLSRMMSDNTPVPSVHPTADGGIQFEWNTPRMAIEVEVTPEGKALALVEDLSSGEEWEADVTNDNGRLREAISRA